MGGSRKSSLASSSGGAGGSGKEMGAYEMWHEFPKTVFAIFGNEFCERFSYYGMRTVLTLYVVNVLGVSQNNSVAVFHTFIVVCYTTPLLGSVLADGYVGKFKTILWISLLYAVGNVVLAVAAFYPKGSAVHPYLDILGLLIIGFGTGGIKPCVSAFGGDQFKKGQERMLEAFFSIFYFSINAGALISTFITPLLRTMQCGGSSTCYPAAFGMPAVLMVVSVVLFVAGSPWYTKKPPSENVIGKTANAIGRALKNKGAAQEKKAHFMDHLCDDVTCDQEGRCTKEQCHWAQFAEDVKALLRVCVMFAPVPVFWALYDQQGSRWVLQAVLMDGRLGGGVMLLPDQMGTFNTALILIFIPVFQGLVYPLVRKVGIDPTPLRRMSAGGLLASASFVIACFLQLAVQKTTTPPPSAGNFGLAFTNLYPCNVTITPGAGNSLQHTNFTSIPYGGTGVSASLVVSSQSLSWSVLGACTGGAQTVATAIGQDQNYYQSVVGPAPLVGPGRYLQNTSLATLHKAETGEGQFKIGLVNVLTDSRFGSQRYLFWCHCKSKAACATVSCDPKDEDDFAHTMSSPNSTTAYLELKPGFWRLFAAAQSGDDTSWKKNASYPFEPTNVTYGTPEQGGIYSMVLAGPNMLAPTTAVWTVAPSNTLSILLQVPQYVVITAGEILFSITGLEFAYSQSPSSMKSVVQAVWLLTVAFGDLIDVIIALAPLGIGVAWELLLFAVLMAAVMVVFMLMSVFWYEYSFYDNEDDDGGIEMTGPSAHQLVEKVKLDSD